MSDDTQKQEAVKARMRIFMKARQVQRLFDEIEELAKQLDADTEHQMMARCSIGSLAASRIKSMVMDAAQDS